MQRKQLELEREFDQNIIKSQKLYQYEKQLGQLQKVYQNAKIDHLTQLPKYNLNTGPILPDSIQYDPLCWSYQDLKQRIKRQTVNLQFLRKLERVKQESLFIEDRISDIHKSPYRTPYDTINQEYNSDYLNQIKQSSPIQDRLVKQLSINKLSKNSPIAQIRENSQNSTFNIDPYNIYQYDDPYSEDSTALVEKYFNGIKAEQYYSDMKRLQLIEQKLKKVEQKQQYYKPKLNQLKPPSFHTPQQIKSSRKQDKTKQKISVPIIKQDLQEGDQTIINTISKRGNKSPLKLSPPKNTWKDNSSNRINNSQSNRFKEKEISSYANSRNKNISRVQFTNKQKLKSVINTQKNQSRINPNLTQTLNKIYLQDDRKRSKKSTQNKTKMNMSHTIDVVSTINNKINYSPYKQLSKRSQSKNRYLPYSKINSSRDKYQKGKSQSVYLRNHHRDPSKISFIETTKKTHQICIPAPVFPAAQQIKYQQTNQDLIRNLCNQKIQNRLKMSTIVFKDSKMRNVKHQMDHLFSKFQNQIKGRKQIKDRINTNPRILRKHKMVVKNL